MTIEKGKKQNPLLYLFTMAWRYSVGQRTKMAAFYAMFIVAESIELFVNPFVCAKILDIVQKGVTEANVNLLYGLLLLTVLTTLIFWGFHGPARLMECVASFRMRIAYRKNLLWGVFMLPLGWHANHHSGDIIDKIGKGTGGLSGFTGSSFEVIYGIVRLVGSYAILVYFSPSAAGIVLGMIIISGWITISFDRVIGRQYEALNLADNRISESTVDCVTNITTVIAARAEHPMFESVVRKMEEPFELFKRNNRLTETKWFLTALCCSLMSAMVLGMYFWKNVGTTQGIQAASVFLLMQYLGKISGLFFQFTAIYGRILAQKFQVLNSEELALDFKPKKTRQCILPNDWKSIRVEGLTFSYTDALKGQLHLKNVSFSVNQGDRIAFVGKSGSGKTTCLSLMRGFYQPNSLRLFIDNVPIEQGFEGICDAVTLVPQQPGIFATNVVENITLGTPSDLTVVKQYVGMACFTEVVECLPGGYYSPVTEGGVKFSGGQRQRLGVARALYLGSQQDTKLVLLDEPTSGLDPTTAATVYNNLFTQFKDRTIIAVVHQLHLLPRFNRIYVFDQGRIIASGSFEELLADCPHFQELWKNYQADMNVREQNEVPVSIIAA